MNESFQLYDTLREKDPEAFKKCTGMSGDVCEPNLGMSQYFRNLVINEADFIFHSAATTRFDDTVKYAVTMNTRGTKFMLDLAKECKKLKVINVPLLCFTYFDDKFEPLCSLTSNNSSVDSYLFIYPLPTRFPKKKCWGNAATNRQRTRTASSKAWIGSRTTRLIS